jgi:hypothetical protein
MLGCCTGSCCASGLLILAISSYTHLKISMCVFQLVDVGMKTARAAWSPQRRPDAGGGQRPAASASLQAVLGRRRARLESEGRSAQILDLVFQF